jgi:hypothetical protein
MLSLQKSRTYGKRLPTRTRRVVEEKGRPGKVCLYLSGFHQVALRLGPNRLRPQGLKEYSDSCSTSDYLGPILGSKCLVTQTTGDYLGLGPSEESSEKMFQIATRTFNPLYCFPYLYTYWSHFSS